MFVMFREIPKTSPRRPDTGELYTYRLIMENVSRVIYADSAEDLMRAIATRHGYPHIGLACDMNTIEMMAAARRKLAVEVATQCQAVILANLEAEMPLADRKLSSWCRELLFLDRAKLPRHPALLWPRSDIPLILVASSYSPVTSIPRTLGATYIDDLDDLALIETAGTMLGWRIDKALQDESEQPHEESRDW